MRHLRHIWEAEGNALLSAIEMLSGIALVLYGICAMSAPIPDPQQDIIPWAVSRAVAPVVWQTISIVIGVLQIICAIHKNPLCSIVTSYPAMVACLFAGISGVMYGGSFDALAWFAIAWGLLNLLVVRHNKKLWDIRSGSAN